MKKGKWLMIEGAGEIQRQALQAAGVPYTELKVAQPRATEGVVFPEEEKDRVLELFGLQDKGATETPTDREGVYLLNVKFGHEHEVSIDTSNSCDHGIEFGMRVKGWLEELANQLGVDIVLSTFVGDSYPNPPEISPSSGEELRIFVHASSAVDDINLGEAQVLLGRKNIFFPAIDPHRSINTAVEDLRRLLPPLIPLALETDKRKIKRLLKNFEEFYRHTTFESYARECQKRFEKALQSTQKKIKQAEENIQSLQQKLVEEIRILDGQKRKLQQMEASKTSTLEVYKKEFEKLLQVPHIRGITIREGKISVFTDRIYISHGGEVYDIGNFRIDVYTDGSEGGLRFYNLTHQGPEGYHHPHVDSSGKPCLGNIQETIATLIGSYQFSVVIMLALQYLESVNTDDSWGERISQWPTVAEGRDT